MKRLTSIFTRKLFFNLLVASCAAMIVFALYQQLKDFHAFMVSINEQPLPKSLLYYVVSGVLVMETMILILLIIPKMRIKGLQWTIGFLTCISLYIMLIQMNAFGAVPCSCAGLLESGSWWPQFWFNLIFLAAALTALQLHRSIQRKATGPSAVL